MTGIRINDRFELRRDHYAWMLVEHVPVDQSHRRAKYATREKHTWHASPAQACTTILDRTGGDCDTAEGLVREWRKAVTEVREALCGEDA